MLRRRDARGNRLPHTTATHHSRLLNAQPHHRNQQADRTSLSPIFCYLSPCGTKTKQQTPEKGWKLEQAGAHPHPRERKGLLAVTHLPLPNHTEDQQQLLSRSEQEQTRAHTPTPVAPNARGHERWLLLLPPGA